MDKLCKKAEAEGGRTRKILDQSIEQHAKIVLENADEFGHALGLIRLLEDDISDRIRIYSYHISKSTKNFRDWLHQDYKKQLKKQVTAGF